MLELYHLRMSVCAAKVRMLIEEKEIAWVSHLLNTQHGDNRQASYLKLNREGFVPTLVHDGRVLTESNVICEYIEDVFPTPSLRPSDPYLRARMRLWTKRLDEGVHAANWTLSACIGFRHAYLAKSPEQLQQYYADLPPERLDRMRYAIEMGLDSPQFLPALRFFDRLLGDMEESLKEAMWLAGPEYTLADLSYSPYMLRLEHLGLSSLIDRRPLVKEWSERAQARPSFSVGVREWLDPMHIENFGRSSDAAREAAMSLA